MPTREAACLCGQLRLEIDGDPWVVSMCHCLACQRRTGSAFGMQAAFRPDQVEIVGTYKDYSRISDESDRKEHVLHFCPECGSQVFYTEPTEPDLIVVSVGSFADPTFPPPTESGYDWRRHPWLAVPETIETVDVFGALRLLYDAGEYAEAADRAQELVQANPDDARLLYNVACCESLAGRTDDALEHLGRAIGLAEDMRGLAAGDPDLAALRDEPEFAKLVG